MDNSTLSLESINTEGGSESDMGDSSMWSPMTALSASIATAFTSVLGSLDRKAGELLGVPVSNSSLTHSRNKALEESYVEVSPQSHKLNSETLAAVDNRLMWHLRQGYQKWHTQSPPSSGDSSPRSRRIGGLSLSSYAAMARSFLPRVRRERAKRNTTAADNTLIDSLDSSFTPTLSKFGLDSDSEDEED